ncbi:hypothetical protein [Sorangium sp. So ce388]
MKPKGHGARLPPMVRSAERCAADLGAVLAAAVLATFPFMMSAR